MQNFDDNIGAVFKLHFPDLKIDRAFLKKVKRFVLHWATKNDDHIDFLGSKLFGNKRVVFSSLDEEKLVKDVFNVDMEELKQDLHSLPSVDPKRKVSSNPYYLTVMYLIHRCHKEIRNKKELEKAVKLIYKIYAYKVITSLLSARFKKNLVSDGVAQTVYDKLQNGVLIKMYDSWEDLFDFRATALLKDGVFYDRIVRFETIGVLVTTAGLQTAIRSMVNLLMSTTVDVIESKDFLQERTMMVLNDGEVEFGNLLDRKDKYILNMKKNLNNPTDFIKEDIVKVIYELFPNLNEAVFRKILEYVSENSLKDNYVKNDLVDDIITSSFSYLSTQSIFDYKRDIVAVIKNLKNYWSSSSVRDSDIIKVKKEITKMIKKVYDRNTSWVISTLVLAVVMYIIIRSILMRGYDR